LDLKFFVVVIIVYLAMYKAHKIKRSNWCM